MAQVKQGDVLFEVDNQKEQAELAAAQTKLLLVQGQYDQLHQRVKFGDDPVVLQKNEICQAVPFQEQHRVFKTLLENSRQLVDEQLKKTLNVKHYYLKVKELFEKNGASQIEMTESFNVYKADRAVLDQYRACVKFLESKEKSQNLMSPEYLQEEKQLFAKVQDALQTLEQIKFKVQNSIIKAPSEGVIVFSSLKLGDEVREGKKLASIVLKNSSYVMANFAKSEVKRLSPGQPVLIKFEGAAPFKGMVESAFSSSLNVSKKTQLIKISIPAQDELQKLLVPGAHVKVKVVPQK